MDHFSDFPLFVDSNLGTHLAISVSPDDTVGNVKSKLRKEHSLCFPNIGEILDLALMVKRGSYLHHLPDSIPIKVAFMGLRTTWFLHMNANQISTTDQERDRGRNVCGARADKHVKFNCDINILSHVAPEPDKKPGTQSEKHIRPGTDTEHDIDSSEMDKVDCMNGDQEKKRRRKGAVTGRKNMVLACKRKAGTMSCRKCHTRSRYLALMHIGSARKRKTEKLKNRYTSRKCVGRTTNNVKYSNKWHVQERTTKPPFHRKKRRESATREVQDFAARNQDVCILSQSTPTKPVYNESEGNCDGQVDCTVSHEDGNDSLGTGKCYSSSNVHKRFLEHGSDQFTNLQPSCNLGLQEEGKAKVQGVHHQTSINEDQSQNFRHHNSQQIFCHAYIPQNLHSRSELERECLCTEAPSSSMSEMVSVSGIIRRYFDSDEVSLTDNQAGSSKCAKGCSESQTFSYAHLWNQVHSCWELETPGIQEHQFNTGGVAPLQTEASSPVIGFYQSGKIRESFLEQSERKDAEHTKIRDKHSKHLSCSMSHEASLVSNMDDSKSLQVNNSSKKKKRKKKKREEKKEEETWTLHQQKMQVEGQTGDKNIVYQPLNGLDTSLDAKIDDFMLEPAVGAASRAEPPHFTSSSSRHCYPKLKPRRMEVGKRILEAVSSLSTSCRKKSSNLELSSKLSGSKFRKLEFDIL